MARRSKATPRGARAGRGRLLQQRLRPLPRFGKHMAKHAQAGSFQPRAIAHRDHKAGYLADLPRVSGYVIEIAKQYPELSAFSQWFEQVVLPRFAEVSA